MNVSSRLLIVSGLYITCLITANLIAVKIIALGDVFLPAAVIVFPFSYIFGDVLTEVYGFHWARRIIWLGFICNFIFVVFVALGQVLPGAPFWEGQAAYETILGYTPRILLASFLGYLVGEFVNSFIMAKLKLRTKGRYLWLRTIGSTLAGQGLDTSIFIMVAFLGTPVFVPMMILYHWGSKVLIEAAATPLTYRLVNYLKKAENGDHFDTATNFSPFKL
ncbi:MAG: transporter [Dehalococcoides mccartyi]|uniref:queuosine precursor transporter n=1 Tax=Dehalococcoides mccartyi TaxID=61435 RepID=UPI0008051886|nr:queuosine precursor transporter [Dehalococcoides mccartyi]AQU05513.1 transporter [Dehalococcoides mccartyi]AQU06959.1 transporter [Dehalococcoides mccartyi]OBW63035.1 MAG: transporter [Dehalococcoides mccartyi]